MTRVRARAGRFTPYETVSRRSESRFELWSRQPGFADGMMYPEYEGREPHTCAVAPKGMAALDNDLCQLPGVDADAIARLVKLGPEYKFTSDAREASSVDPIQSSSQEISGGASSSSLSRGSPLGVDIRGRSRNLCVNYRASHRIRL